MSDATAEQEIDALVHRAQAGEESAFTTLLNRHRAELRAVVRHMLGNAADTDDIVQESSFRAWQGLAGFAGESRFGSWLCAIGVRQSIDHLRHKQRWRARAQIAYQNACNEDAQLGGEVVSALSDPEFRFSAAEHIAYCFSCVGRSLPPEQQAALLMREVMQLGDGESAKLLGTSESEFRQHVADARRVMESEFEALCSLSSQQGACFQCKGLRNSTPEARRGPEPPRIESFEARLEIVREADLDTGASQGLHDLFWRRTEQVEEAGIGSTEAESDFGSEGD